MRLRLAGEVEYNSMRLVYIRVCEGTNKQTRRRTREEKMIDKKIHNLNWKIYVFNGYK